MVEPKLKWLPEGGLQITVGNHRKVITSSEVESSSDISGLIMRVVEELANKREDRT